MEANLIILKTTVGNFLINTPQTNDLWKLCFFKNHCFLAFFMVINRAEMEKMCNNRILIEVFPWHKRSHTKY